MLEIFTQETRPLSAIKHVAVAIGVGRSEVPQQLHTGIIHLSDSRTPTMLHLAWHNVLRSETPDSRFLFIEPKSNVDRLIQLAAYCRRLWRRNKDGGMPYAFSLPNDVFDSKTGEFLNGGTCHGLTCSSFVLAVFQAIGLPLAKVETWPRASHTDTEWQSHMVVELREKGASVQHISLVEKEIGSPRFKPQQVAACAANSGCPCDFKDIEPAAIQVSQTVFDYHLSRLIGSINLPERLELEKLARSIFEDFQGVPFEISATPSEWSLAYRHSQNHQKLLNVVVGNNEASWTISCDGTSGSYEDVRQKLGDSFFTLSAR